MIPVKIKLIVLVAVAAHSLPLMALDSFSYSGRLVNSNGSPVTGDVNLRFDLSSTEDPTDILCSKTVNEVPLSQGIFNVKLDFLPADCENTTIQSIMENVASNHNLTYQVTDLTNSRTYSSQAIYSVPSSFMANFAKSIGRMGATSDGQVLKWNAATSKWIPGTVGTGNGTVTTINTGPGLFGGPIVNSGTISVAPGGITDSHLATGINPAKLSGSRDATKYLKGDNTWSSFQADLLATILNGFSPVSGSAVSNSDSVLQAFGKLQGQVSTLNTNKLDKTGGTLTGLGTIDGVPLPVFPSQVVNKQYVDDLVNGVNASQWTTAAPHIYYNTGNVGIGTSTPNEKLQVAGNIALNGNLRLRDSGSNYIELKAPLTTSGVTLTLPADAGTSGQALTTNGAGVLSWQNPSVSSADIADGSITNDDISASANIDQAKIAGLTTALAGKASDFGTGSAGEYLAGGKVWTTLNTDVVPEGSTRLYFTEPRVLGTDLAGFTTTSGTVTSADTVLSSIGKLAGNQGSFVLKTGDSMSGDLLMGGNTVTGLGVPSAASDAATKAYVDSAAAAASHWTKTGSIVHYNLGSVGIGTATPRSKLEVAGGIQIGSDADTCGATKVGTLRYNSTSIEYCNGTAWQAFGISGAGITSLNGSTNGTQTFASGTSGSAPAWSTAAGVHTLNIPFASASGVTAGLISKTDYDAFSGKLSTSTTLSGDVSGTYNATSVDKIKGTSVAITTLTSGNFLRYNGTNWVNTTLSATDITSGTLPISRGGTGATTADGALNNLLPTQTGNNGKVLSTNGTTTSWTSVITSPAGTNGQVQFNNSGAFGASNNFFWDNTNSKLGIGTANPRSKLEVAGGIQIGSDADACGATKVGTLRYNSTNIEYCNGSSWQAFGISGAGITSLNGSTNGTQTFASGTSGSAPAWSTAAGVHTLNIPFASASGVTAGLISKTDYDAFSGKLSTTTTLSGDVSGTYNATSVDKIKGTGVAITSLTSGNFLRFNGTNWINAMLSAADIPALDAAKITSGTLPISRGGTGATTADGALNNLLPTQTGNSGKVLSTNGTTTSWTSVTSSPAGTNGQVQFNNSGAFGASSNFFWDNTNSKLGLGTAAPSFPLSLGNGTSTDGSILSLGYGTVGTDGQSLTVAGPGSRMMWYAKKAAFRAGSVDDTEWDDANIGLRSVAFGDSTKASGNYSFASGSYTTASDDGATAFGDYSTASGMSSTVIGSANTASNSWAVAIGQGNIASGNTGVALGSGSRALSTYGVALGRQTTADSYAQVSVGRNNLPIGTESATTWVATDPIFVVGNGTGTGASRSNAMMVLKNGKVGIGTNTPQAQLDVATTGTNSAVIIPRATTANRPSTPVNGMIRYNTSTAKFEGYQNGTWTDLIGSGTVTGVTGTAPVVVTGTTAPVISMAQSNGTTNGYLSSTDWTTFNSKLGTSLTSANILVGNASNIATPVAASGDVTLANTGAFTVTKLQGRSVATTAPSVGSFLKWNNTLSNWEPALFTNCNGASEVLHYILLTDTWSCDTLSINSLLPSQTGNSGRFLTTNGTSTSWATVSATPAGLDTQVQFNNAGAFGASANMTWNNISRLLNVNGSMNVNKTDNVSGNFEYLLVSGGPTSSNSTGTSIGIKSDMYANGMSMASKSVKLFDATYASGSSANVGNVTGYYANIWPYGSSIIHGVNLDIKSAGTTASVMATGVNVDLDMRNTINNAYGLKSTVQANSSGVVSNSYGLHTQVINYGTTTNGYGVYIGNINATNKWSIFANDSTAPNYFAGNIGIGTTNPGAKLEVAGQVKITGGTPGTGKVLTSDATGLATWETPSGGGDFMADGSVNMTGSLKLADGTSALPSLTFGSDLDTGFFKYSSNMLGMSLGGVGRYYYTFDSTFGNAKLGINTIPSKTLHVKQQTVSGVVATFEAPGGAAIELKKTGSSMYIQQDASGNLSIDSVFNETVDPSIYVSLANSNVGIGTTTSTYKLNVGGDINSTTALRIAGTQVCTSAGCTSSSDERLKENIRPLENALEKILKLNGMEYDYIDKIKFGDKHQIGIVAQEVEKVFPEVVVTDEKSGLKSVAYDHLVAPLIEAVKSIYTIQTKQSRDIASKADLADIETLKNENETLRKENEEIKARLKRIEDALQVK